MPPPWPAWPWPSRSCPVRAPEAPSDGLPGDLEEYLSWLVVERGRAPLTVRAYRQDLVAYVRTLAERGRTPAQASAIDVEAHLARLRQGGHAPASVARAQSVLRGLHRFLLDEGRATVDPTDGLEGTRVGTRLPKALTEAEVGRLLEAASGPDPRARRDRALLELLYGTGARISEVVGLDLADLARDDGLLRLLGKGAKERIVPIGARCQEALDDWLCDAGRGALAPARFARRQDAEAVFLNLRGSRLSRQGAFAVVVARARSARTCCDTPAPPTCSPTGPTSGSSRSCWATPPSAPPSSTPRSRPSICGRPTWLPTRVPERRPRALTPVPGANTMPASNESARRRGRPGPARRAGAGLAGPWLHGGRGGRGRGCAGPPADLRVRGGGARLADAGQERARDGR